MKSIDKLKINKSKTSRFLILSLLIVLVTLIGALSFYVFSMKQESEHVLTEVGTIYMKGMSEKIAMHFETTVNLRMDPLDTILKDNPPSSFKNSEEQQEKLRYESVIRGYDYLAFLDSDGDFHMIYGNDVELVDHESFLNPLLAGEKTVAVGHSIDDELVMMGFPAKYNIGNGQYSIALVAGIPSSYINEVLSLDEDSDSLTHSHIIRRDGSFVIRCMDINDTNYFEMIRNTITDTSISADMFISDLSAAMNSETEFSSVISMSGERRHIYCTPLEHSEWYLVTIMPYGVLDTIINGLDRTRFVMFFVCMIIIAVILCGVFFMYFKMTRKQIKMLDQAIEAAKHESRAKSEFLSNMSHDIRTPMNAIVGMTAIASTHLDNRQQLENCLAKISLSSKHLLGLINDVLDMSKIESGKMTLSMSEVSLREVMDAVVSIAQPQVKAKHQQFDVFIDKIEYEHVYCDSLRLNQVLLNLISNAIKFTPENGRIQIHLSEEPSERGDGFTRVHFSVEDNGIGMSEEFQKSVFDKFIREDSKRVQKTEGTGLGMAITKYIVDAMKGTIKLKSELGKGTRFDVTVDLEKSDVPVEEMILPEWHMLVVDDDEMTRTSAVDSLKKIGINADAAIDGETAVKMVVKEATGPRPYQIILLDWKLPGIDGLETAREIRKALGSEIPILLVSAYDWSDIEKDATEAGITGFISKPLFQSTLYYGLKRFANTDSDTADGSQTESKTSINMNPAPSPSADAIADDEEMIGAATFNFEGMHLIIAEDNDLNWEIANELLGELGFIIDRAENGKICAEMLESSKPGYYRAILMDIRMPIMSGYEACEMIRSSIHPDHDIPIIAMTADAFSDDVKRCLNAGMNAHTSKPIDVNAVTRLLGKFIKQREES